MEFPNRDKLLLPIADVVRDVVWRDVFPVEGCVFFKNKEDIEKYAYLPEWSTFESLFVIDNILPPTFAYEDNVAYAIEILKSPIFKHTDILYLPMDWRYAFPTIEKLSASKIMFYKTQSEYELQGNIKESIKNSVEICIERSSQIDEGGNKFKHSTLVVKEDTYLDFLPYDYFDDFRVECKTNLSNILPRLKNNNAIHSKNQNIEGIEIYSWVDEYLYCILPKRIFKVDVYTRKVVEEITFEQHNILNFMQALGEYLYFINKDSYLVELSLKNSNQRELTGMSFTTNPIKVHERITHYLNSNQFNQVTTNNALLIESEDKLLFMNDSQFTSINKPYKNILYAKYDDFSGIRISWNENQEIHTQFWKSSNLLESKKEFLLSKPLDIKDSYSFSLQYNEFIWITLNQNGNLQIWDVDTHYSEQWINIEKIKYESIQGYANYIIAQTEEKSTHVYRVYMHDGEGDGDVLCLDYIAEFTSTDNSMIYTYDQGRSIEAPFADDLFWLNPPYGNIVSLSDHLLSDEQLYWKGLKMSIFTLVRVIAHEGPDVWVELLEEIVKQKPTLDENRLCIKYLAEEYAKMNNNYFFKAYASVLHSLPPDEQRNDESNYEPLIQHLAKQPWKKEFLETQAPYFFTRTGAKFLEMYGRS
ncbi:MAG TPA: hypothetical protein VL401_00080 [Alphaproteobacteria bacterium]|jgi:hypothetical protein|nr:hypothetical protein [Alphaproteobacteria bacterium]